MHKPTHTLIVSCRAAVRQRPANKTKRVGGNTRRRRIARLALPALGAALLTGTGAAILLALNAALVLSQVPPDRRGLRRLVRRGATTEG